MFIQIEKYLGYETLTIIVNKYEDRTKTYKVHKICSIRKYAELCELNNMNPYSDNYVFDIIAGTFKILLGVMFAVSVMLTIGLALVIRITS